MEYGDIWCTIAPLSMQMNLIAKTVHDFIAEDRKCISGNESVGYMYVFSRGVCVGVRA